MNNPTLSRRHALWRGAFTLLLMGVLFGLASVQATQAGDNGGTALDFDGTNDYVNIGTGILTGGSYTKEAWVYARTNDCRNILSSVNNTQFWMNPRLSAGHNTSYQLVQDSVNFPLNSWQHVAVTYDQPSTTMRLYRNGVQVAVNTSVIAYTNTQPLQISGHGGTSCVWNGLIEDVRVWDHARSLSQIQAGMFGELTGSESGLRAYYRFTDGTGSGTLTDNSGNGHTGTLTNMNTTTAWVSSTAPIGDSTASTQTNITGFWAANAPTASGGLTIANNSFLNDVGDDIIFGHNNGTGTTTSDLPAGVTSRANRIWYCDLNDTGSNGGSVNLTFDLDDFSGGVVVNDATRYSLLERAGTSGVFSVIVGSASSVNTGANTVTFTGVGSGTLCSYVTLGVNSMIVSGDDGPGGVGTTDGTSVLELWLRANTGTYTDTGCTSAASNGNTVACWTDQSGNGRNVTQSSSGARPQYQTGMLNSQSLLDFDGSSDYLDDGGSTITPANALTILAVASTARTGSFPQVVSQGTGGVDGWNLYWYSGGSYQGSFINLASGGAWGDNWALDSTSPTAGQFYILSGWRNSGTTTVALNSTATSDAGVANTIDYGATPRLFVGAKNVAAPGSFLDGGAAEVIYYSTDLTSIQRILVENYLAAKYAIDISASGNDHYDGDTALNGDFDLDVAGIGRLGGNNHTQSHAAGMIVVNSTFLQDDGDWLLFGHRTATNANSTADLPTTGAWATAPNPRRWERHFYIDVTDAAGTTGGTVDIIFDYSEGGMNLCCPPGGDVSNYRLLRRAGTSGQFSDIATATTIVGAQVQFLSVDVSLLGSNFTLGTLDYDQSPTAVTLQTFSGDTSPTLPIITGIMLTVLVGTAGLSLWRRKQAKV